MRKCNKTPYDSKAAAAQDAKCIRVQNGKHSNRMKDNKKSFGKLYPYACRFCGNWHLTSQKQK